MPPNPANPGTPAESLGPRKRQAPLDDNGEPRIIAGPAAKKKKSVSKPKQTQHNTSLGLTQPSRTQRRSPTVEDVPDETEDRHRKAPRNPRHIIEAADGSDDDDEALPSQIVNISDDSSTGKDDDSSSSEDEQPEESEDAELSMCL